jgi:hypothetical protein
LISMTFSNEIDITGYDILMRNIFFFLETHNNKFIGEMIKSANIYSILVKHEVIYKGKCYEKAFVC